jgi:hypothetical protein
MKMSKVGVVAGAFLIIVAAIGFGIAQAGGNHSDRPVLNFQDQEALGNLPDHSHIAYNHTIGEFMEWQTIEAAGGSHSEAPVLSFEDVTQLRNPTETGSLPEMGNSDSSIVETEGNMHREGEDTGGP